MPKDFDSSRCLGWAWLWGRVGIHLPCQAHAEDFEDMLLMLSTGRPPVGLKPSDKAKRSQRRHGAGICRQGLWQLTTVMTNIEMSMTNIEMSTPQANLNRTKVPHPRLSTCVIGGPSHPPHNGTTSRDPFVFAPVKRGRCSEPSFLL